LLDGGDIEGFKFELVVEDDGGTPEGGAAVANKLVSDPNIVAIAGHIFSGATDAAMPIYEGRPASHDVALRHQPRPDPEGLQGLQPRSLHRCSAGQVRG
jgi:hypothetical protein